MGKIYYYEADEIPCPSSPILVDGVYKSDLPSGDSLNVEVIDQNDASVTPLSSTVSGGVATVKIPTALEILIPYKILDGSASIVVVTGSEGTIDTIDSTGLFAFTIVVNSTPVTVPFTLAVGDVVDFTFTSSTINGNIKLNGYA